MYERKTPLKGEIGAQSKKKDPSESGKLISRRSFLLLSTLATVSSSLEVIDEKTNFIKKLLTFFQDKSKNKSNEKEDVLETINEDDAASLRELINFDSLQPIKLGQPEIDRLKKHWEGRYEGDKKSDLDGALVKMKDWESLAKDGFLAVGRLYCLRNGIAEEEKAKFLSKFESCFYLSIPESYWRLNDKSCASAVGPFQFIEKTATEYNLKRDQSGDNNFDERRDPIKSSKAAAQFLLSLYERMNHNWDLVLSAYNGGFAGKFKAEALEKGQELNYLNFLEYLGEKIEKIKKELSLATTLTHEVIKKGETFEKIAKLYKLDEKNLALINKIEVGVALRIGDKIIIPPTEGNRRKNFYYHIEGFSQNINYPAKLYAVLSVLEKRKKETGKDCLNQESTLPKWKELDIKQEELYFRYYIKKGDTVFSLSKKFKINAREIFTKNNLNEKSKLKLGRELLLRNKKQPKTLASLARPGKLELMKLLNPAIKNANEPLPSLESFPAGISIRYPAESFSKEK